MPETTLHDLSAAEATRNAMTALAATWRRDDEDALDTFGQHLMGGAVLSCAEQLEAALATLPAPSQAVRTVRAETLRLAADPRNVPDGFFADLDPSQREAVAVYASWILGEAHRLSQPTTEES